MKLSIARLGVLVAAVTGLLAVHIPAADATTGAVVVFAGRAVVDGGQNNTLSYPCVTGLPNATHTLGLVPIPLIDINDPLCLPLITGFPLQILTSPKKGDKTGEPTIHINNGHNPSSVAFTTDIGCVAAGVTVGKLTKLPLEAGLCGINAAGIISGHCGFATGTVNGSLGPAGPVNVQNYNFNVNFTGIGPLLILNGVVTKVGGGTGWVLGLAVAAEDPQSQFNCGSLHRLTFIIAGVAVVLIITG